MVLFTFPKFVMCPVVLLAMISSFLLLFIELATAISVTFVPDYVSKLKVGEKKNVTFSVFDLNPMKHNYYEVLVADSSVATIVTSNIFNVIDLEGNETNGESLNVTFTLEGRFLGYTNARVKALPKSDSEDEKSNLLQISVVRKESKLNTVFIASVATLVSLSYINMGCALDLRVIKEVLKRPVAPAVGFSCQYLMMPLIAYGIGQLLFDTPVLKLGLFVFGCSPGGGASNMWTVLLKGNLNLSVTMTFISTLAALVMMPLWIFTLGKTLFSGTTRIPFTNIFVSLVSMVIPMGIGLIIQKYLPKVATFGRRILATTCLILIIYIVAFGTYANLYMFKLFTWQTVVAALISVWFGFLFGALAARFSGRPVEDVIAISVETGIQNSGIAIVLLAFSLQQPDADLASVMPVAASIMMPIPLTMLYISQKIRACCSRQETIDTESLISENKHMQSIQSDINETYNSMTPMN